MIKRDKLMNDYESRNHKQRVSQSFVFNIYSCNNLKNVGGKINLLSHTTTTKASTSLKSCSRGTDRQTAMLRWSCVVGGGGMRAVDGAQRNNNTLHSQDYPDRNVFIC